VKAPEIEWHCKSARRLAGTLHRSMPDLRIVKMLCTKHLSASADFLVLFANGKPSGVRVEGRFSKTLRWCIDRGNQRLWLWRKASERAHRRSLCSGHATGNILESMRNLSLSILIVSSLLVYCSLSGSAQSTAGVVAPSEISADLGTCSALITVTGIDSKPIYGAKMNTRIQYGLLGVKRLDLEAFTDADGQVKITNLPEALKKPMYIHITKGEKEEIVQFKPNVRCRATFNVQLR
jgi:hypothetical protein